MRYCNNYEKPENPRERPKRPGENPEHPWENPESPPQAPEPGPTPALLRELGNDCETPKITHGRGVLNICLGVDRL